MSKIEITQVESIIVDLPLKRLQRFSALGAYSQSVVVVLIHSKDGLIGLGEATTPSGPWWSGESAESIKLHIDQYLAPLLLNQNAFETARIMDALDGAVYGNMFAKAALETALLDLVAKTLNQPLYNLLGGKKRDSLPVCWPLATGDVKQEIEEAEEKLDKRLHNRFKLKMGAIEIDKDVHRACQIAKALEGHAKLRVDPNAMWSESEANRAILTMQDAGIEMVEQPLERWNHEASARLTGRYNIEIMIDEGMTTAQDMMRICQLHACDSVSLKVMKSGGIRATKNIANIAEAGGISLYMGTFLESSLGTAANMQLCATLGDLPLGGELVGPMLIAEDICQQAAHYADYQLHLSEGVGLGVELDFDKLNAFRRDRKKTTISV